MVRAFTDLAAPFRRTAEAPTVAPARAPALAPSAPAMAPRPEPPFEPEWPREPGLAERILRRVGRAILRTAWMVVRWVATVALVGGAAGVAIVVGFHTVSHVASHSATLTPVHPITLEPLATRSVVYARDGSVLTTLHAEE